MNIAIDVTPLHSGHKDRGVGAYTKLLIEALQKYEIKHSYHFFVRGQKVPNTIELIHYPYFDPYFVTLPFIYPKPAVVTVHDLIPLVFPEHFPAGVRGSLVWQYQRFRLTRARRIIADSASSKNDTVRITGIAAEKIDVVHLAAAPRYRRMTDSLLLERMRKRYGLPEQFVLYVGDVNWNKNMLGLLEAIGRVKTPLVLVGKAFLDESLPEMQQVNKLIELRRLDDAVIKIGGVPQEDLVAIYNLASVHIQPSLYEGFGLPVLEAMACGVPVVTSAAASLSEIAGPAIRIDPAQPDDIARGIKEAVTLPAGKRSALVRAQMEWANSFSWQRVARETVASYEKALA